MTSSRSGKTFVSHRRSGTTGFLRAFRVRISTRSALEWGTRKPLVSTRKTSWKKFSEKKKYRIRLDHQILTNHGVFYAQALYNELMFEMTLAAAKQVVKGPDVLKLKYKLTNIQLEYKMIRSKTLADDAHNVYSAGKEFLYDHVVQENVVPFKKGEGTRIKVNLQRRSLGVEPYVAGTRDSEKYFNPT